MRRGWATNGMLLLEETSHVAPACAALCRVLWDRRRKLLGSSYQKKRDGRRPGPKSFYHSAWLFSPVGSRKVKRRRSTDPSSSNLTLCPTLS